MHKIVNTLAMGTAVALFATGAYAQSGTLNKAVGGYTFEDAAKESPDTKNFHSADGHLTFAIVTHTAGNGFFDPVYVGAKVAADMIGANLVMLGSEAPIDDIPREIEILNQIIQDPTIDGLILTTPQVGAYNDIVKHMLDQGIPVATTNSFDPTLYDRDQISHTGQSAAAAAIGGAALAKCILDKGIDKGSIIFPSQTTAGNVEVNNRVTAAFEATVKALNDAGKLANFTVDAGADQIGIAVNDQDIAGSIVTLIEFARRCGRHLRAQRGRHPGDRRRGDAEEDGEPDLHVRLRSRSEAARGHQVGRPHRLARTAALPAGLLAGHAALPADRPRCRGREPGHPCAGRDQGQRRFGRQALRELTRPGA